MLAVDRLSYTVFKIQVGSGFRYGSKISDNPSAM